MGFFCFFVLVDLLCCSCFLCVGSDFVGALFCW